jgi:lactate permease
MIYLLWALPALAVIAAIGSGRLDTIRAAVLGLLIAMPVAVFTGPAAFGGAQLMQALARGLWIGATIAPYILGGLLFWQIAAHGSTAPAGAGVAGLQAAGASQIARRRLLFFACFLIGPFAESATGFGVGMLGTVTLIRRLDIAPRPLMVFALLSQTMIPWGAMGSGTMLAAAFAHIPGSELGLYSMVPISLLMLVWLALFWRTAREVGLGASVGECLREALWIAAGLALLAPATAWLGPESALLASYGPLIVLRYLMDARPDRHAAWATARRAWPYIMLIAVLVATRLLPALKHELEALWKVAPFGDLPAWSPFFHAGSWLVAGGVLTALARGQGRRLAQEARSACRIGRPAILAVFLFAMMAEVLSGAGISSACAQGMFDALHEEAVLATPLLASVFGILANSGNAPNSLFMPSQLALAIQAGLSIPAVAALQHVSGTSMSLFSPVRMSISAGLAHGIGQERAVYRTLLPYAACCLVLLLLGAAWIVVAR